MPWVSFCLATYRRPERIRATLRSILDQSFSDLEIIVTDNDPERSAEAVVREINDRRVTYRANERNLGMVKNFNHALSLAIGEFVVMITDDDPVYPEMLSTLHDLWKRDPAFGAYYGACEVDLQDEAVATMYGHRLGRLTMLAKRPEGEVWTLDAGHFPEAYFRRAVFPYVLWSCGVVRRDIAIAIGGMPDYGSPFLTDFGYIALAGARAGVCCINKALGFQAVHSGNFGRRESKQLVSAVRQFHDYLASRMADRPTWPAERAAMEEMLSDWFRDHLLFLWNYHKGSKLRREIPVVLVQAALMPFLRTSVRRIVTRAARGELRGLLAGVR
jgi:glycosyltransferase involved in cell wall biosynthesis